MPETEDWAILTYVGVMNLDDVEGPKGFVRSKMPLQVHHASGPISPLNTVMFAMTYDGTPSEMKREYEAIYKEMESLERRNFIEAFYLVLHNITRNKAIVFRSGSSVIDFRFNQLTNPTFKRWKVI